MRKKKLLKIFVTSSTTTMIWIKTNRNLQMKLAKFMDASYRAYLTT